MVSRDEHLESDEHVQVVVGKLARDARGVLANERRRVAFRCGLQLRVMREQRGAKVAKNGGNEIGIRASGVIECRGRHARDERSRERVRNLRRRPAGAREWRYGRKFDALRCREKTKRRDDGDAATDAHHGRVNGRARRSNSEAAVILSRRSDGGEAGVA